MSQRRKNNLRSQNIGILRLTQCLLIQEEDLLEHCDSPIAAPVHQPLDPLLLELLLREGLQRVVRRVACVNGLTQFDHKCSHCEYLCKKEDYHFYL